MWLKISKAFLAFGFFTTLLFISGCIEEPTIDPVKRPFSVSRIGNFMYNVDAVNVKIINPDGTFITHNNLQKNSLTAYFDVVSGKRRTLVTNVANGDTILNKEVEFISYEESSVLLTGYFSKSNMENTFAAITYPEGDTYVEEKPAANQSWLHFIHISGDSPTDVNKTLLVKVALDNGVPTDTATLFSNITRTGYAYRTLTFGNYRSTVDTVWKKYRIKMDLTGPMTFKLVNDAERTEILGQYSTTIEKGYRYFFFVNGEPKKDAITIFESKQLPLPVRSK
ncbi:MAG: hypothetical protein C4539_09625 [Ignavibacteriales bacterium]|nr:MAG: hypothetical protein C4539_09625 [Ignavibacteriales bacterium]